MNIDYAPTGREFVTGSYDRTVSFFFSFLILDIYEDYVSHANTYVIRWLYCISQVRIFQYNGGHSREVYHTKRMQRSELRIRTVYI